MKLKVIIRKDEEDSGWYNASVPALPGCHSQGKTREDALKNIKEAIELYLEEEDIKARKGEEIVEVVA